MQRARFWILCALGALLVVSGALLFGSRHWAARAKALQNILPADVDMRLDNLVLSEAGSEGRSMVINAASAHYYKTSDVFLLENVRARIMTDNGEYLVAAERGRYEQGEKKITLDGNVSVVDNQSGVLSAASLRFNFGEGMLISDGPFCYSAPAFDLDGEAFVFHTKDKRLEVEGRTHTLFN